LPYSNPTEGIEVFEGMRENKKQERPRKTVIRARKRRKVASKGKKTVKGASFFDFSRLLSI
jgi:hypothetical protein